MRRPDVRAVLWDLDGVLVDSAPFHLRAWRALFGARALLRSLRERGFRLALVSSTPRANIDLILSSLGVSESFDVILGEEDVTRGKPDPECFLLAAEPSGVP